MIPKKVHHIWWGRKLPKLEQKWMGTSIKNNPEYETENYSAGVGIDFGGTFFDMSYTLSKKSGDYVMYSPDTEPHASVNSEKHYLLFTLGFRY